MALISASEKDFTRYCLGFKDVATTVECPQFMGLLLRGTLSGWSNKHALQAASDPDVNVHYDGKRFYINCSVLDISRDYSDIIDALNTVFLCLAYLCLRHWPNKLLLHCAAYQDQKSLIAFGPKKSGKSTLVTSAAMRGNTILADDLLFWDQKRNCFETIGLPLRLRRPISKTFIAGGIGEKLIVGRSLAYSKLDAFKVAPAGTSFFPDDILEAKELGQFLPIPLFKTISIIKKYQIHPRA